MKSILTVTVIAILSLSAEASRNRQREARQEGRIAQGVQSGELTRHETKKLIHGQKKIDAYQKKANADGELSAHEKAHLEKMQDRQSRRIYNQKHDEQSRGAQPAAPVEPAASEANH